MTLFSLVYGTNTSRRILNTMSLLYIQRFSQVTSKCDAYAVEKEGELSAETVRCLIIRVSKVSKSTRWARRGSLHTKACGIKRGNCDVTEHVVMQLP